MKWRKVIQKELDRRVIENISKLLHCVRNTKWNWCCELFSMIFKKYKFNGKMNFNFIWRFTLFFNFLHFFKTLLHFFTRNLESFTPCFADIAKHSKLILQEFKSEDEKFLKKNSTIRKKITCNPIKHKEISLIIYRSMICDGEY